MENKKYIFLDNVSTTRVDERVLEEMLPYLKEEYGNPQALYELGTRASKAIETAREKAASLIGADPGEIYFTSCGTESNNFALEGLTEPVKKKGNHIITTEIEHYSILNKLKDLQKNEWEVSYVKVDENGFVDPMDIEEEIREDTILISVMHANNEIGTIQNLADISKIAKKNDIIFHSDGVATAGIIPVDVTELGVDAYSFSSQQMYGPKGAAALYVKKGRKLKPFLIGGVQERGRRAGTENVPGIVGFGKAAEIARREIDENMKKAIKLRDMLIDGLLGKIEYIKLNGDRKNRLPGNAHISFEYIEGESIVLRLNYEKIAVATGSSCASQALKSSHVLKAIGLDSATAQSSILFSIGKYNTKGEIGRLLEVLPPIVSKLRDMSPLYNKSKKEV